MSEENERTAGAVDEKSEQSQKVDSANVTSVMAVVRKDGGDDAISKALSAHVAALASKHGVQDYKILFLFDDNDEISHWHANRVYSAASSGQKKDILLVVQSRGGRIEPAYLISKTCARLAKKRFIVAVPRKAKSAATLISLGAHEIHMGLMSELGPIDPQIGGFPALGMQNALSLLADLSCKYPGSSEMIGKYLSEKLDLRLLGYFERISESAIQYAERLLDGKKIAEGQTARALANHFVNHYKDHGFVIDADEATKLLGGEVIKQNTNEYRFANDVHESLDILQFFIRMVAEKDFDYVGALDGGLVLRKKKVK